MVYRDRGKYMTLTPKQQKIIAVFMMIILVYLAATFMLYDIILKPQMNKISGAVVSSTVNVSRGLPINCNFTIYEGENLISFHCLSGFYPIDFLLRDLDSTYESMFGYDITNTADPWKSYNPSLPDWAVQDLLLVEARNGYWIMMNQNYSYNFEGIQNSNSQIKLYKGWNLIGYPKDTINSPEIIFASIYGSYNMILQYKKFNNTWYYYVPNDISSTLTLIEPDYGYWINMTEDAIWTYS
jgi:hypothetical protein